MVRGGLGWVGFNYCVSTVHFFLITYECNIDFLVTYTQQNGGAAYFLRMTTTANGLGTPTITVVYNKICTNP